MSQREGITALRYQLQRENEVICVALVTTQIKCRNENAVVDLKKFISTEVSHIME